MKTMTVAALRTRLGEFLTQQEPVVVTQNGQPSAVLLPIAIDGELKRLLLASRSELMACLAEADRRISESGGIPHDEFWSRVNGKPVPLTQ